jgi:SHS2 domain-containing protein
MSYELLDHTGDLGIRVWAADLKGLFQEAARALFAIITDLEQFKSPLLFR